MQKITNMMLVGKMLVERTFWREGKGGSDHPLAGAEYGMGSRYGRSYGEH